MLLLPGIVTDQRIKWFVSGKMIVTATDRICWHSYDVSPKGYIDPWAHAITNTCDPPSYCDVDHVKLMMSE